MKEIEDIKKELENIKQRNKKVELNKAWETSWTRRVIILIFTYFIIGITFNLIGTSSPWTNAIIPTLAFFISTLSLHFLKNYWQKHLYKKSDHK